MQSIFRRSTRNPRQYRGRINNRKRTKARKNIQIVLSEPAKTFVDKIKTKSGQFKNRYKTNPNAKQVKLITHS